MLITDKSLKIRILTALSAKHGEHKDTMFVFRGVNLVLRRRTRLVSVLETVLFGSKNNLVDHGRILTGINIRLHQYKQISFIQ